MLTRSLWSSLSIYALVLGGCGEPGPGEPADPTSTADPTSASSTDDATATSNGEPTGPGDSASSTSADPPGTSGEPDDTTASPGDSSSSGGPPVGCGQDGFHVEGGRLYDVNCNEFILRGINYPYVWYSWRDDTAQQFADMASVGANAVRLVLATGDQWERVSGEELEEALGWAMDNALVAVLEVHDSTGWSEQSSAVDPQAALDYWLSPDIRAAIDGREAHVIVNIANEPMGNTTTDQWAPFHVDAVAQLREAGVQHTLIVDAPNWGQDWSGTMRDGVLAQQIFDADPEGNVVFSVHMYDVYGTAQSVEGYLGDFLATGLPLIVGEFAADHGPGAPVAAEAIMASGEAMGVGYLGWSWSGNSSELSSLDIALDFAVGNLSPWGELLINGPDGLLATAQPCTCFD